MNRTRVLDRRYRRIMVGSLAVSAGIHIALFGLRFEVPLLPSDPPLTVERIADPFDAVEVVAVEPAELPAPAGAQVSDPAPVGPALATLAAPAQAAAASATASAPPVPEATPADIAFEELAVFDPLSQAPIRPVHFTDLPVAMTDSPVDSGQDGEAEDDLDIYVPGSIGAAKRKWSGNVGTSALGGGGGFRIFGGTGSGGHCPMPGGGRAVPPVWK